VPVFFSLSSGPPVSPPATGGPSPPGGEVIRGDERPPCSGQLDIRDLDSAVVVDVIQMENREDARIGTSPPQVMAQVDAVQPLAERARHQPARPLVEVSEQQLRAAHVPIADD